MAIMNILKGLIGKEDINYGAGTFTRRKSDGTNQTMSQVPSGVAWLNVKDFGAKGDNSADDTAKIQEAIDEAWNSHVNAYKLVYLPAGNYQATQLKMRTHVRLIGDGAGTNHSESVTDQFQSQIIQPAGTNTDLIVFDSSGAETDLFIHDSGLENIMLRGGWTGTGDTTTTSGSAILFDGVTPGQNMYWRVAIHNFKEHGVQLTRHALPGTFQNIQARKLGGDVIHVETVAGRNSQMFVCNNIHGDLISGAIIKIDESAITNALPNTYLFSNIKHEVNSGDSGDSVVLNDVDRGTVVVQNLSALESGGTANAVVRITGQKAPHLTVVGCRAGASGVLIDDDISGQDLSGKHRNAVWFAAEYRNVVANNNADIIEQTRQRSDASGTTDAVARFQRGAQGKMEWGDGANAVDTNLYRAATNRLQTDDELASDSLNVTDGITAPSAISGRARIFVDTADGDLKVIFGDGTTKTIVVDT